MRSRFLAGVLLEREISSGAFSVPGVLHAGQRLTGSTIDGHVIQLAATELAQLAGGLFTAVLAILFSYVLLVHGRKWVAQSAALLPLDVAVTGRIVTTVRESIVANVNGILVVSAADAVLCGSVFWLAGVGSPVLWGTLTGLASMMPIVGSALVWVPIAIVLAIHGTWIKALLVAAGCLAGQESVSLLLRPRVVGESTRQPPLLIALSILGATDAFGVLGVLLEPVILSVLAALVQEFRIQLQSPDIQSTSAGAP